MLVFDREWDGEIIMGKTFKDHKDYDPLRSRKPRRPKLHRGCALHGQKDCEWCMNNLTVEDRRNFMPQWEIDEESQNNDN